MYLNKKHVNSTTIVLSFFLTIIFMVAAYLMIESIKKIVISEASQEAKSIAATTARFIEENVQEYRRLSEASLGDLEAENMEYYNKMNRVFRLIKQDTGVDFIFTQRKISDSEIAYILDGESPESETFSPIGSKDGMSEEELRAFNEGIITATDLITDIVWGDFLTAFAPIKESGEVIGLVGVDFSSDYIKNLISNISLAIYATASVLVILSTIIFYNLLKGYYQSINVDYMTGLMNKRSFVTSIENEKSRSSSTKKPFSLALLDIDNFKTVNDNFGHICGDEMLQKVAFQIKNNTKRSDLCFRFGGDEFAIIFPQTTQKNAEAVCKAIQGNIRENCCCNCKDDVVIPTLSIGICEWKEGMKASEIIEAADKAMYLSKRRGKNGTTIFIEERLIGNDVKGQSFSCNSSRFLKEGQGC